MLIIEEYDHPLVGKLCDIVITDGSKHLSFHIGAPIDFAERARKEFISYYFDKKGDTHERVSTNRADD